MPEYTRTHGLLGVSAPSPSPDELGLSHIAAYLAEPLPAAPLACDYTGGRAAWGMLGNDQYGDCGVAGEVHLEMVAAHLAEEPFTVPLVSRVIAAYKAYTGGRDSGVVLSAFLSYCHSHGLLGRKLDGFAPVHAADLEELKATIALFGSSYVGVQMPRPAMEQFDAHTPWDLTGTRADDDIEGGHCVVLPKYGGSYGWAITWGALQPFTWRWWRRYATEAWAVLPSEYLKAKPGLFNVPLLRADLAKLAA